MIAYDRYHINRCDAIEFLAETFDIFPESMPKSVSLVADGISESIFKGWRFVIIDNGELVFADCLSPCIRASDMENVYMPYGDMNGKQ